METPLFKLSEARMESATSSDLHSTNKFDKIQLVGSSFFKSLMSRSLFVRPMMGKNGGILFNN